MLQHVILSSIFYLFADGAKILGVFPTSLNGDAMGYNLMNELVRRNHEVTVLNLFPVEEYYRQFHVTNYTDIPVESTWPVFFDMVDALYRKKPSGTVSAIIDSHKKGFEISKTFLTDETVKPILRNSDGNKYDLILMEYNMNDAALVLAKMLNIPVVLFVSSPPSLYTNYIFANPTPSSYIPNIFSGYTSSMSVWQILTNWSYNCFSLFYRQFIMISQHEKLMEQVAGERINLDEVTDNVDLLLLNSHSAIFAPLSLMPNMVEMGGFHIKENVVLPKDLQDYLDRANNGVLYFSMRHYLIDISNEERMLTILVQALGQLEQQVLWHFQSEVSLQLPDNIKSVGSFTTNKHLGSLEELQHGILAHQNVLAVFSHGDINDLIEAVYFGVPVITVPVSNEQTTLANQAAENGYAYSVPYDDMSEDNVLFAISEVLNNDKYSSNIKDRSHMLKEGPVKPLDLAMYWIERAVSHNEGFKYFQSPGVRLPWYKRNIIMLVTTIGVILLLTIITIILVLIFYLIFKHIIHYVLVHKSNDRYCKLDNELNEIKM